MACYPSQNYLPQRPCPRTPSFHSTLWNNLRKRALLQGLLSRWGFYHSPRYCPVLGGFKLLMPVTTLEHFFFTDQFFRIQLTRLPFKFQRTLANNSQPQDCKPPRYQLIVAYSYFSVLSVVFKHPAFSMTYPKLMWLLYMNIIASLLVYYYMVHTPDLHLWGIFIFF